MSIWYELRSRSVACSQYYLRFFPVLPLLCYLFTLSLLFTDCKTSNRSWILFVLVFFHTVVFFSSFVYYSLLSTSDLALVFVQTLFSVFVFFSITLIIGRPYSCVIDSYSYAVSGLVFVVFNVGTVLFSYWLHCNDDYPYYAPLYYTGGNEAFQDSDAISQYEYSSLISAVDTEEPHRMQYSAL